MIGGEMVDAQIQRTLLPSRRLNGIHNKCISLLPDKFPFLYFATVSSQLVLQAWVWEELFCAGP